MAAEAGHERIGTTKQTVTVNVLCTNRAVRGSADNQVSIKTKNEPAAVSRNIFRRARPCNQA